MKGDRDHILGIKNENYCKIFIKIIDNRSRRFDIPITMVSEKEKETVGREAIIEEIPVEDSPVTENT